MRLSEFLDAIEMANAWILYHRRAERENPGSSRLNLGSLKPHQMVEVTLSSVTSLYTLFDLEAAVGNARPMVEDQIDELARTFDRESRYLTFRGKFQVSFMRAFLTRLAADANSPTPSLFPERRRVPFNVSERNFLSDLSQYAETPNSLREFVNGLN